MSELLKYVWFWNGLLKAYDTLWCDGVKLWDIGDRERMWCVINYEASRSALLLEGENLDTLRAEQGVAHGCGLYPTFSVL